MEIYTEYRDVVALCADMSLTTEEMILFGLFHDPYPKEAKEELRAEAILDNVYVHNMFNNNINRGGISYDR